MSMISPHTSAPDHGCAVCNYCDFVGPPEPRATAQDRAVWHVYEVHPDLWADVPGLGAAPSSPRPEGALR